MILVQIYLYSSFSVVLEPHLFWSSHNTISSNIPGSFDK